MGALRLLLAVAVLVGHSSPIFGVEMLNGGFAVELFFAVSGFYMAFVLREKYSDRALFYTNRFLRLYPGYLVVLAGTYAWFLICWRVTGHRPPPFWIPDAYAEMPLWQGAALVFSNLSMVGIDIMSLAHYLPGHGFLFFHDTFFGDASDGAHWANRFALVDHAWSISAELWFYLLVPFLVAWRSAALVVLGLASIAIRVWMDHAGLRPDFFFPAQLSLFVIGVLLFRASQARPELFANPIAGRVAMACSVVACFAYPLLPPVVGQWLAYVSVLPSIPFLFAWTRKSKLDRSVGELSYPLYLVHMLVIQVQQVVLKTNNGGLALVVSLVAAFVLYRVVERPVDRWRQRRVAREANGGSLVAPAPTP